MVVGSLPGEWSGILQWFPTTWFWIGDQGWEYLELGRLWQILLAACLGYLRSLGGGKTVGALLRRSAE